MHITEVREMSTQELIKELEQQERSLMNLRFQKVTRQLSNTNELSDTRKNVARIKTVIRERQIVEEFGLVDES